MGDDRTDKLASRFTDHDTDTDDDGEERRGDSTEDHVNDSEAQSSASGDDNDEVAPDSTDEDDTDRDRLRDRKGRTFYLDQETVNDLDALYREMAYKYGEEYDDDLVKNKQYYPAVVRAAVNRTTIEEELGVDDAN